MAKAEARLAEARSKYWRLIADAHDAGISLGELGRILGVSRQRAKQLVMQAKLADRD